MEERGGQPLSGKSRVYIVHFQSCEVQPPCLPATWLHASWHLCILYRIDEIGGQNTPYEV